MIPTFLDLRTGKTAKGDDQSVFWWTEGNGACDCNRVIGFGADLRDEMRAAQPDTCYGCKRFVAVDVEYPTYLDCYESDEGRLTKEQVLIAMNAEYGL